MVAAAGFYPNDDGNWGESGQIKLGVNEFHASDNEKDVTAVYHTTPEDEYRILKMAENDNNSAIYDVPGNTCQWWTDKAQALLEGLSYQNDTNAVPECLKPNENTLNDFSKLTLGRFYAE